MNANGYAAVRVAAANEDALDYMVALANWPNTSGLKIEHADRWLAANRGGRFCRQGDDAEYMLEKHRIQVRSTPDGYAAVSLLAPIDEQRAPTREVAAMRALVVARLGEVVAVPAALLDQPSKDV